MIAYLGTGLLGGNFVRAFRGRGEDVHVWNRSPEKAKALEEVGARAFATPAEAVRGATRIHITVSDDAAVDALLADAAPGIGPDCIIIDHTTTAPVPTAKRVREWTARGIRFQHAPVFMGPSNALEGTGTMLGSGDATLFEQLRSVLEPMTGKLVYLGSDPSRAAAIKLMGNLFLLIVTGGVADMFAMGRALNVPEEEVEQIFTLFNAAGFGPARAKRMSSGDLSKPSWTLAMGRKDARLMMESTAEAGGALAVLPAVAAEMDRWIAAGHGAEDYMIIGRERP